MRVLRGGKWADQAQGNLCVCVCVCVHVCLRISIIITMKLTHLCITIKYHVRAHYY